MYLNTILHESNASSATNAAIWSGTSYFTPLLGGVIADAYLGHYWTIFLSTLAYLIGMIIVTLSAFLQSLKPLCGLSSCFSASTTENLVFSGLYLVALGSGGVKSSLLPLGADQFDDKNPTDRERKGSFFSWFYICITIGLLNSGTLIVWIQENVDWALGYGICTLCLALAFGGFLFGTPTFRLQKPSGSPLKSILQVLVASFRKMSLEVPTNGTLLHEAKDKEKNVLCHQRLEHTNEFRFLDKAAIILDSDARKGNSLNSWRLCTITQVEELKILLRILPIWITCILYSVAYSQTTTTILEQGKAMNTRIGHLSIPPATLIAFEVLCVISWVLIHDKIIVPITRLSHLQKMGLGRFLMILAMATTAFVETKRLESVGVNEPLSIAWQLPQFFIIGGSEAFSYISQLEFFYDQAPNSMKSTCTALYLLSISLGNYLSSFIISLVMTATTTGGRPGWIPDNLNEGHLDYFFWGLTVLCTLNFVAYLACARNYTLKKVILEN